MLNTKKTKLGQFYTTRYDYILQSFSIPEDLPIIEPFAGNGDLLKAIPENKRKYTECYDIDPKQDYIIQRDTLLFPPSYKNKFVLTNPPYLAKNKSSNKEIYNKYNCDDLYKCFIKTILLDICEGGIIIVPLNFISSIRTNDIYLRKSFLSSYHILKMNIFEEQVFSDTSYTVCSILFMKKHESINHLSQIMIFPSKLQFTFDFSELNNYTIGGDIYNLPISNKYVIERATKHTIHTDCITNILVKCIDDNAKSKIQLKMVKDEEKYIDNTPNLSERSYATLVIHPALSISEQHMLVSQFNTLLEEYREKYNSLFLTNYRESNTIARKRISFSLVFQICGHLLLSFPHVV